MTSHRRNLLPLIAALFLVAAPQHGFAQALTDKEALEFATDAYVYGYPLVTMELTRRVMTNVTADNGHAAPIGRFARMRTYPSPDFKAVTAPNADTLYTTAWFDVSKEPWIVSIPDLKDRYALFPLLSGWTDVFDVPGKRTTGTGAQKFAITGPGWKGRLPDGVKEYKSSTGMVWLLGRIYCTGTPEDYKAVHALQDEMSAVPLSAYGKTYVTPPALVNPRVDMKTPVRDQVGALDAEAYFNLLAQLLKDNPPTQADAPMVAKLAKLGVVPGQEFDAKKLGSAAKAIQGAPKAAADKIAAQYKNAGVEKNGWMFSTRTGVYGTDYLQRAFITAIGLGANRPQDAVYPSSRVDADGKPYNGANKYVLTFPKGQTPPAKGFWSLTMYDAQMFFVANPINLYAISERNKLKADADGSISLYVQNESPGKDRESNWLPAPKGDFNLMLRLYWPKESPPSIVNGTWTPPAVKMVK